MSKVSMAQAAKIFDVSRPTLLKHLQKGKISGEKIDESWQLDLSELARIYTRRGETPETPVHAEFPKPDIEELASLRADIRVLQAELNAEKQARELVQLHLEDVRKLLDRTDTRPHRRRWWPF
jgi:hypothetical protein